jgi:hypothetical protein
MSLFDQLSGFEFPDVLMNSGPLPSTAGGPVGSDGSIDGVINGTSALLENISPYAIGKSARTGSDRNYQQIPHRFQYIIPRLYIPHFDNERRIHISHAVDQGDIAFLLYGGERAWLTTDNQFGARAPPCAFATIEVVNYILLCMQASTTKNWELIRDDLIKYDEFKEAMKRRSQHKSQEFDAFKIFRAIRLLVQQVFVPHGICAGSEHQGGQHEHTGGHPVQAAVNFVTTMTIDGKNVDLVNYWYGHSMVAGDELIFRLEKQEITESKEFTLSRYYKEPVSVAVSPYISIDLSNPPATVDHFYWQLVPDIVRKTPVQSDTFNDKQWWCDHRCEGYWRIAQTFQTRAQNNSINAFTRGLPLEVTFAPVYQSFADCEYERASHAAFTHSVDQYTDLQLTATVTPDKISWHYDGGEDTISIEVSNNSYHVKYDKDKCRVYVDFKEQHGHSLEYKTIENIQFFLKSDMKALLHDVEPSNVTINPMLPVTYDTGLVFDTHPKTPDQTMNPDFFVRIVFDHTKKEGFMNAYVKKRHEVHEFDSTCWLEKDNNYSVLKSIEFSYHYTGSSSKIAQSGSSAPPQKPLQGGAGVMNFGGTPIKGGLTLIPPINKTPGSAPMGSVRGSPKNGNKTPPPGGGSAPPTGGAAVAGGAPAGVPPDTGNAAGGSGGAAAPDAAAGVPVDPGNAAGGSGGAAAPDAGAAPAADAGGAAAADVADQASAPPLTNAKMTSSFPTAASFGLAPQFEDDVAMSKKKRRTLKIFDDIL